MLCAGKDCAEKHPTAFAALTKRAGDAGCAVEFVKCQGSCEGPTAVVHDGSAVRWFERLAKPKSQRDLVALATGETTEPSTRLTRRELTGKARAKAAKRLRRQGRLSA